MMVFVYLVCLSLAVFFFWLIFNYIKKKKSMFDVSEVIALETVILFSNYELANQAVKIMARTKKELKIQCGFNEYVSVFPNMTASDIVEKILLFQEMILNKIKESQTLNYNMLNITQIVHLTWLRYANERNYRTMLEREFKYLLETDNISRVKYKKAYKMIHML